MDEGASQHQTSLDALRAEVETLKHDVKTKEGKCIEAGMYHTYVSFSTIPFISLAVGISKY